MAMNSDVAKSLTTTAMLSSVSCANTAAATQGTGTDISAYEGTLVFIENVGTITGTLAGKIITSASSNLSSPTDVGTFTARTTSNDNECKTLEVNCSALQQYVGYVGTIVTGPALIGVSVTGSLKYV
ncbi:MAG: hypothetical protein KA451_15820 [Methyloversatilis sp.]|jgi:hypothetical protein|nr:hypothetical protein [Methyloversatilis sp.]